MTEQVLTQAAQAVLAAVTITAFLWTYRRHRFAALTIVWTVWLLLPFVRRLFDLTFGFTRVDVLSVLPFVLTMLAGLFEFARQRPSRRALLVLGLAAGSFLAGVPAGLDQPVPLLFGLVSYGGVLFAAPIGYADVRRQPELALGSLGAVLLALVPVIALYALVQYYTLGILPWDIAWISGADLNSLLSPEPGRVRAFSTLNAPVPLAAVAAVSVALVLALPKLRPYTAVVGALGAVALALTFVRSAWVSLAVGIVVYLAFSRLPRNVLVRVGAGALMAVAVIAVGWQHPTVQALLSRAGSVAAYSEDTSAQARADFINRMIPDALSGERLGGHGLGQSGAAVTIGGGGDYLLSDHGYLSILYQSGVVGFVLLAVALGLVAFFAVRQAWRRVPGAALHVSLISMFLVIGLFTDVFYGVLGVMMWYVVGRILATDEAAPSAMALARENAPAESEISSDGTSEPVTA